MERFGQVRVACAQAGVTLVEMIVALATLAILLGIAVPAFTDQVQDRRLRSLRSALANDLAIAKSAARTSGRPVWVCAMDAPGATEAGACGANWSEGWLVIADDGAEPGRIDAGDSVIGRHANDARARVSLWAVGRGEAVPVRRDALRFDARGWLDRHRALAVACDARGEERAASLLVSAYGSARTLPGEHDVWRDAPRCAR